MLGRASAGAKMADSIFEHPRLAQIYDALEPERPDLELYVGLVSELRARSVLDVGCGTGTFACLLAHRGVRVTGLDPAQASLDVARRKCGETVGWVHGEANALPRLQVDLVTMTGNVAQVFLNDEEWDSVLRAIRKSLRRGGYFTFESRDPAKKAWLEWTRERTYRRLSVAGEGLETWTDLLKVRDQFVSFRKTFVFECDGAVLTSDSTLRFRDRDQLVDSLKRAGMTLADIRDAPDRPGLEFVFIARRPEDEQLDPILAGTGTPVMALPEDQTTGQAELAGRIAGRAGVQARA